MSGCIKDVPLAQWKEGVRKCGCRSRSCPCGSSTKCPVSLSEIPPPSYAQPTKHLRTNCAAKWSSAALWPCSPAGRSANASSSFFRRYKQYAFSVLKKAYLTASSNAFSNYKSSRTPRTSSQIATSLGCVASAYNTFSRRISATHLIFTASASSGCLERTSIHPAHTCTTTESMGKSIRTWQGGKDCRTLVADLDGLGVVLALERAVELHELRDDVRTRAHFPFPFSQ